MSSITGYTCPSRTNGTIEHFKTSRWNEMNKRVKKCASYLKKRISVLMTKDEFYRWCDSQKPFIWFLFSQGKKPTIDRIDGNGHYDLVNIRILEWSENSKHQARKKSKPIKAYKGNETIFFHGVYSVECINFFGRNRCRDIIRCLKKQRNQSGSIPKTVNGWSFEYQG